MKPVTEKQLRFINKLYKKDGRTLEELGSKTHSLDLSSKQASMIIDAYLNGATLDSEIFNSFAMSQAEIETEHDRVDDQIKKSYRDMHTDESLF